jgi:hypothetical protein
VKEKDVDGRDKPGHDEFYGANTSTFNELSMLAGL